jgi:hypothetical protein
MNSEPTAAMTSIPTTSRLSRNRNLCHFAFPLERRNVGVKRKNGEPKQKKAKKQYSLCAEPLRSQ